MNILSHGNKYLLTGLLSVTVQYDTIHVSDVRAVKTVWCLFSVDVVLDLQCLKKKMLECHENVH